MVDCGNMDMLAIVDHADVSAGFQYGGSELLISVTNIKEFDGSVILSGIYSSCSSTYSFNTSLILVCQPSP